MVANREVGQQIDAVDIQAAHPARIGERARNPSTAAAASRTPDVSRISRKQRLCDTALTVGDLQHRFAGDLIDGRLKRGGQRAIDHRDRHNDGNAERDAKESQRRAQPVALHMAPGDRGQQTQHQESLAVSTRPSRKKIVRSP